MQIYCCGRQEQEPECGAAGDIPAYSYRTGWGDLRGVDIGEGCRDRGDGRRECVSTPQAEREDVHVRIPNNFGEAVKGYDTVMHGLSQQDLGMIACC